MSPTATTHRGPLHDRLPLPSAQRGDVQHVLMVEFAAPDGRRWQAIGGGDSLADAIAFARDSCPAGATWRPSGWSELYGD